MIRRFAGIIHHKMRRIRAWNCIWDAIYLERARYSCERVYLAVRGISAI
jgi:hypothetical protein